MLASALSIVGDRRAVPSCSECEVPSSTVVFGGTGLYTPGRNSPSPSFFRARRLDASSAKMSGSPSSSRSKTSSHGQLGIHKLAPVDRLADDRHGPRQQEPPQVALAHLRYPAQPRLAPVVCCRGTRPSQADNSHLRPKLSIGGAKASMAWAVIGPTPGSASAAASPVPPYWLRRHGGRNEDFPLIEDSMDGHSLPATSKTDSITPISCRDVGDLPASAQPHDPPETGPCIVGLSRNACLARSCSGARSSSGLKRRPSRRRRAKHRPWSGSTRYRRRNPCWRRSPLVQTP